ncbi:YbhB/YbcL family Raf kinase inhibitor-like protein [Cellvibrio sp. ARAG 10.3]|uniref:YbhB/YbcL family Raf kinase inhibitor-like protein n=1 Tax=Cellvibrio sp. ARAG 10.3 TaxID=3451358 RepID=UPI003F47CDAA
MMNRVLYLCAIGCINFSIINSAQAFKPVSQQLENPEAADVTVIGHVLEPKQVEVNNNLHKIRVPRGFEVSVFASDLINPRMMAVAQNGDIYVTRRSVGDVIMLRDTDGDGNADEQRVVANRPDMHGIAIKGTDVYLATVNDIYRTAIQPDGSFAPLDHIVDDLPDGGQHPNRTLVVGPDGKVYVSVGSTCNACDETNPESATLLQMEPDGSSRTIFASGLRNTIGFGFEPQTGELYGMDHGIDWLGDNEQYEELNHIVKGKRYGWPYIYGDSKFNPQDEPPGDITLAEWAAGSVEPIGFYTPHAAPMQMTFYTAAQFPENYRGDAFIAMRGSWNRKPPSGYEVARIRFDGGKPVGFEAFAQGFLGYERGQWVHRGRLAGIAQAQDGALLVADDTNGVIYRIAYTGRKGKHFVGPPTNSWNTQVRVVNADSPAPDGDNSGGLTMDLVNAGASIPVESKAFMDGNPLPEKFSAVGENISPPLRWQAGPEGTQSYVVIMEDPDAPVNPPFIHWLLYNIPGDVTHLEEGVPPLPQLALPEGALQGKNERGSLGYFGPRPPTGDPAHRYYFQIFALDKQLDVEFGLTRDQLIAAMEGHVLGTGFIMGTFAR